VQKKKAQGGVRTRKRLKGECKHKAQGKQTNGSRGVQTEGKGEEAQTKGTQVISKQWDETDLEHDQVLWRLDNRVNFIEST
jgi:hypothetical protein